MSACTLDLIDCGADAPKFKVNRSDWPPLIRFNNREVDMNDQQTQRAPKGPSAAAEGLASFPAEFRDGHAGLRMELTPTIGVGVSDLQHAARAEIDRIIKKTNGNELAQIKLLIERLRELNLITGTEIAALFRLAEVGYEAGTGKRSAKEAYFESRDLYNKLLAGGKASPVALVLASSAVGSYSITESPNGSGTVVFAKGVGFWEGRGAAAGAAIGTAIGGPGGALIGGAVGGIVGAAVDRCDK